MTTFIHYQPPSDSRSSCPTRNSSSRFLPAFPVPHGLPISSRHPSRHPSRAPRTASPLTLLRQQSWQPAGCHTQEDRDGVEDVSLRGPDQGEPILERQVAEYGERGAEGKSA